MEVLKGFKNLDKKTKISIITLIAILIIAIICAILIVAKNISETKEVAQTEELLAINIEDVTDENIQFEYNAEPTMDPINVSVTSYDNEYNLYYYIQTLEETEMTNESQEQTEEANTTDEQQNIDNNEYILYSDSIVLETNSNIYFKYEKNGQFSENAYKLEILNIMTEGETSESATEEELEEEKVDPNDKSNNTSDYYIKVNYQANTVTIYKKDSNNDYTIPVKAMVCSTGTATPTSGVYKITNKYVWRALYGGVYGQYATRIVGSILFHSVPYSTPNHDALKYTEYDKLGTTASAGCIRLTVADAKWIYDNCSSGTMVEFYASSNPGPLGKPSAMKISSVVECRNYDPTDPVAGNPWATYTGQTTQTSNSDTSANTSTTQSSTSTTGGTTTQIPETSTGNSDLAGKTYCEEDTTTANEIIAMIKEKIEGATVSIGSKEKAQAAGASPFEYSEEAVINKINATANYYVYVETEYTYDSTGTSASPTKTYVYIYTD